ncbi:hypothetical protein [Streptomyces sp. YGL11-2]|uniref:hypothetical protein n=1 Tax=Streptomyces sp. YGL11-2 TaxID=3414028 RepID=UPI003CE86A31
MWCTSWRVVAARVITPLLGLLAFEHTDLPRLSITTSHPHGYLWKRDTVDRWLGDAPAVGVDDDFTSLDHQWAVECSARVAPTQLIRPNPRVGLLPEHIAAALGWLAQSGAPRTAA